MSDPRADASGIPVYCTYNELARVSELRPNPANPNRHSAAQVGLYAAAIRTHGWRRAITVSTRSGLVVRGHGAILAAQQLGVETVPIERQAYVSDAHELADIVADNRLSELADLDFDGFLGAGTTLIAAENLGRKCFGCEISPGYLAVILQRYADAFPGRPIALLEPAAA